jgi:excisionase family DNA binding protein
MAATLSIGEVAALLGVSRNSAYQEAQSGEIAGVAVLRVGRRLLVPAEPLRQVLGLNSVEEEDE